MKTKIIIILMMFSMLFSCIGKSKVDRLVEETGMQKPDLEILEIYRSGIVEIKDNMAYFTVSRDEAVGMGLSAEAYDSVYNSMLRSNELLAEQFEKNDKELDIQYYSGTPGDSYKNHEFVIIDMVIRKLLVFHEDSYILKIDEQEALEFAYYPDIFAKIKESLESGNKLLHEVIDDLKNDSSISDYYLSDETAWMYEDQVGVYETMPEVQRWETNDQSPMVKTIMLPEGKNMIYGNCLDKNGNVSFHLITVVVNGTAFVHTRIGGGQVSIQLPVSNMPIEISYQVNSEAGGQFNWS